jgi:hypothetical protein
MKILGVIILILALGIAIIPQFTTCESQGRSLTLANGTNVPMKCNWTAKGEIAVAVPFFGVGMMMLASRRKESQRYLSIFGLLLGIMAILLPTNLIGVCSTMMVCNTVMRPSLIALGSVAIITSLVGMVISFRQKDL